MNGKRDNIYIYLWEEFNTVYIGRTVNPKGRHYQHKHRETESTYKFSSEHHVEHPKMIIIENDLTLEEGVEREKYWIEKYKENSQYYVLNKSKGGQLGKLSNLSDEERKTKKIEYYKKNREKILNYLKDYNKKYYQKNKKEKISYQKEYNKKSKERIKKYMKEYVESHKKEKKEYDKIYSKKWYEKNKKKKLEYMKQKNNAKL